MGAGDQISDVEEAARVARQRLVDRLVAAGSLTGVAVEAAMRSVPRHAFLPQMPLEVAYQDEAIPTKVVGGDCLSSCSQPAMIAIMLDQLEVEPGQRVLEIGAGTGYNAALLAHLAAPTGSVVSLDIDSDLVEGARAHLAGAGIKGVELHCADGAGGWGAGAPYDRIVATVGVSDVAPAWVGQLKADGRLVVPLSLRGVQQSVCLVPEEDHLASRSIVDCGFIPLRGWLQGGESRLDLPGLPGVQVVVPDRAGVDPAALARALTQAGPVIATGVVVTTGEELRSLARWLAFSEPGAARLVVREAAGTGTWPAQALPGWPSAARERTARLLMSRDGQGGLAALTGLGRPSPADGRFVVGAQGYGPPGQAVPRLVEAVRSWDRAGRPTAGQAHITVHRPLAPLPPAVPAPAVVDTPHARIVVRPG